MNSVDFNSCLHTFNTLDAASYLRLHSWKLQNESEKYSIWENHDTEGQDFELLLPKNRSANDFQKRVAEFIETLWKFEKRALHQIIEELLTPHTDIIRARIVENEDMQGTLPLDDGANIFAQVRNLMLAAACAAWMPKKVFANRKPEPALKYIRSARIGQTKVGSYIISIHSPVPPILKAEVEGEDENDDVPSTYARKVVETLNTALTSIEDGIQLSATQGLVDGFVNATELGVSANLCESLLGVLDTERLREFELSFSWAPSRGKPRKVSRSINRFGSESIPYLQEASAYLRRTSTIEDIEVIGIVKKLAHIHSDNHVGEVTLDALVEDERRVVVVTLDGGDHRLATQAYTERRVVSCIGELSKRGKVYELKNPRAFHLLPDI